MYIAVCGRGQDIMIEFVLYFHDVDSWLNLGHQTWCQVPLNTDLSCQSYYNVFLKKDYIYKYVCVCV